ncbi:P-loop containing nucleoside triphosphate hydrolase protein [Suillus plorans]|uniref:P-loop containing nucleoside triphosphate hydrolase protein n=1 Tax=Suillus plorans TaxID=116603 RepID=A0A9P7E3C8_9AGAM|nr:P-loop containing nucleoside triphosphate hydrolase protein [Suillus plorans]KAG1809949.1 P-loop containing nucleoside triphosphate hydrolase protein [Suillus plorans]
MSWTFFHHREKETNVNTLRIGPPAWGCSPRQAHAHRYIYEARKSWHSRLQIRISSLSILETYAQMLQNMPYVVRMLKDMYSIPRCFILISAYLVVELLGALIPAFSLWALFASIYTARLSHTQVETAMETRTVDMSVLVDVAVVYLACTITMRLLKYARSRIIRPVDTSIRRVNTKRVFHSLACLDVPTHGRSRILDLINGKLGDSHLTLQCEIVEMSTNITMAVVRLLSQLLVLVTVLREQQDVIIVAILSFSQSILSNWDGTQTVTVRPLVRAAKTTNKDFSRMKALERLVLDHKCRKELVAGNLGECIAAQFCESSRRIGDDAVDFSEVERIHSCLNVVSILREMIHTLPQVLGIDPGVEEADQVNQILFALRVMQEPMTAPLYFVSLILMYQASFSSTPSSKSLFRRHSSLAGKISSIRAMFELADKVRNEIVDGTKPFPEDKQSLRSGISIEFRNVTFQYPDSEKCAFRNVSFKVEAGQLCVIMGVNGSGKSTILKLISRLYDPTDGTILINDQDIKTLKLADLRDAMSILFQDYSHFPVPIRENIGLGNPAFANDDEKIHEAARLGGAEEFIDDLPDGFDTWIDDHVQYCDNYYNNIGPFMSPDSECLDDLSLVHRVGNFRSNSYIPLSGGQMQRLAVSRTLMRSLPTETEPSTGMLLFDEPSASLDPTAEHTLFERLQKLRGSKTMIFSTHRFAKLTRHADLILYMDGSLQEQGTHDELMRKGGEYARIWNLQAMDFL